MQFSLVIHSVLLFNVLRVSEVGYIYYAPTQGALRDDAVWRLSRTSGRRAACAAGRLDGAYWLIGPGSAGLAQGSRCTLPLQAWAGAYRGGRPPTACFFL